jgi:hypothetical protein
VTRRRKNREAGCRPGELVLAALMFAIITPLVRALDRCGRGSDRGVPLRWHLRLDCAFNNAGIEERSHRAPRQVKRTSMARPSS